MSDARAIMIHDAVAGQVPVAQTCSTATVEISFEPVRSANIRPSFVGGPKPARPIPSISPDARPVFLDLVQEISGARPDDKLLLRLDHLDERYREYWASHLHSDMMSAQQAAYWAGWAGYECQPHSSCYAVRVCYLLAWRAGREDAARHNWRFPDVTKKPLYAFEEPTAQ